MIALNNSRSETVVASQGIGDRLKQINVGDVVLWIVLILLIVVTVFPFLWVVRTALTSPNAVFRDTTSLLPVDATLSNFERVLGLVNTTDIVGQNTSNISA